MSSDESTIVPEISVSAKNLAKCYRIYDKPIDRLKQAFWRGRKCFFKEFWALRHATFEIRRGETVGIIASNGSGKSTLLQLICNILPPSEGELYVNGRIAALLELGAGFNPEFTGRENVMLNGAILGLSQAEMDACYDDIVRFADIGDFIDRPVKTYSSGMYVRLAFATAINVSPDILVVDEALSVGDIRFQQKCMARIRKFCETGTVIFVSHDMGSLTELCSRAIWIEGGEIRMDGRPKAVTERYIQFMYQDVTDASDLSIPNSLRNSGEPDLGHVNSGYVSVSTDIHQFGNGDVTIEKVRIISDKNLTGVAKAGKRCKISFIFLSHKKIDKLLAGFTIKDRFGRVIIADNTGLMNIKLPCVNQDQRYEVCFFIEKWPNLKDEDYTLSVALGEGTEEEHSQCHLIFDIISFRSISIKRTTSIFSVLETKALLNKVK